ncbi:hypothetical protein GFS31_10080 [Leptolyngbya sp. BL0902]|uniref:hypothetical protein n=1 Tax=Leptolyngbya sp. BL0902 TaxID=1115757 RepID=UPI0018E765E6|nr:hypothetical protein [Leptolyngbya sp. BL0902]QQE64328.1 hypothetical protein GFS31_10080 [Leptolyngbya sp. BL0902]
MKILEETPYRLHIEFREECAWQLGVGAFLGVAALVAVLLVLVEGSARSVLWLLFAGGISAYAFIEKIPCGCLIDRGTGQLTIFQRNILGQTRHLTCNLRDIRTIQVKRRTSGRGRPCSASVDLKSGQQLSLMSHQPCAKQRQIVERLVRFLEL